MNCNNGSPKSRLVHYFLRCIANDHVTSKAVFSSPGTLLEVTFTSDSRKMRRASQRSLLVSRVSEIARIRLARSPAMSGVE
jgi:hypothetical protein